MTPQDFVSQVRSIVVHQGTASYKDLLEATTPEGASDRYWKRVLTLHRSLNEEHRVVLLEVMRQVAADTVSHLFGILDGVCALEGVREDFLLTSQFDNRKLNGDLQDLFCEAEERERNAPPPPLLP